MGLNKIFEKPKNGLFFGTCYRLGKKYNINPNVLRVVFTIPSLLFIFPILIYTIITFIHVYKPRTKNEYVVRLVLWFIIALIFRNLTNSMIFAFLYLVSNYIQ